MFFEDLSPDTYLGHERDAPLFNVGWLDAKHAPHDLLRTGNVLALGVGRTVYARAAIEG